MNDYLQSTIRNALQCIGGLLASRGLLKDNETDLFIGAGMSLVALGWSVWHQYQHRCGKIPPDVQVS